MGGQEKTCNTNAADYQLSRWRAIHTLIHSCEFKDLFKAHGTEEVQKMVDEGNLDFLRDWIKEAKHGPLASKSVTELRMIAGKCGIRYYCHLTKQQLLVAIIRSNHYATIGSPGL